MNSVVEKLKEAEKTLWRSEGCLRQGQVIYAYRHMGYLIPMLTGDEDKTRACGRIVGRLRKGEQIDAHDEIKSLLDNIRNEIRKLETPRSDSNPPNP